MNLERRLILPLALLAGILGMAAYAAEPKAEPTAQAVTPATPAEKQSVRIMNAIIFQVDGDPFYIVMVANDGATFIIDPDDCDDACRFVITGLTAQGRVQILNVKMPGAATKT